MTGSALARLHQQAPPSSRADVADQSGDHVGSGWRPGWGTGVVASGWSLGRRRKQKPIVELADIVDAVRRSLSSGASFQQALREATHDAPSAVSAQLRDVLMVVDQGQSARQALTTWAAQQNQPEAKIVAASLAFASVNEAGSAQALYGVSQSLRDRADLAAEVRSQAAQSAASLQMMVLLPLAFLLFDLAGSKTTVSFLVGSRWGHACLTLAVGLDLVGWLWMRALIGRRLTP